MAYTKNKHWLTLNFEEVKYFYERHSFKETMQEFGATSYDLKTLFTNNQYKRRSSESYLKLKEDKNLEKKKLKEDEKKSIGTKKPYTDGSTTIYLYDNEAKPDGFIYGRKPMTEDQKIEFNKKCRKTKLERYGDPTYNNPEKSKQTCLERYGVEYSFQSDNNKTKSKATMLDRYGVEYYSQTDDAKLKSHTPEVEAARKTTFIQTCRDRFGSDCYLGTTDCIEKSKQTKLEKYGDENYVNWEKAFQTRIEKSGSLKNSFADQIPKMKQTMLEKYGVEYSFQLPWVKEASHSTKAKQKQYETKKNNGTFNTSQPEEQLYQILCKKYGEENIIHLYKDSRYSREDGYQFECDFYIISEDLFIELNAHWTHGPHPFDGNNTDDLKLLNKWKSKQGVLENGNQNSYYIAEKVWTELDPLKAKTAKENKLNYLVIYSLQDILNDL